MQLVNGSALVARLLRSVQDLGVQLRPASPVVKLLTGGHRVTGGIVSSTQGQRVIHARRGVVLAAGGFPHDIRRRKELFAHAPTGTEHWALPPHSVSGDGVRVGESVGGEVDSTLAAAGAWWPVSLVTYRDGTVAGPPKAYAKAQKALKLREDLTFSDDEIDLLLPDGLRKNKAITAPAAS
jgi:hypothetical protein